MINSVTYTNARTQTDFRDEFPNEIWDTNEMDEDHRKIKNIQLLRFARDL